MKHSFGGQVSREAFVPNKFISSNETTSNHMGEQKNQLWNLELTIVSHRNANIIPEMFEPSINPNPIIIEDVCLLLIPKIEKTSNSDVNG